MHRDVWHRVLVAEVAPEVLFLPCFARAGSEKKIAPAAALHICLLSERGFCGVSKAAGCAIDAKGVLRLGSD